MIKNNYTNDSKYLAVINKNGLWIKDEINGEINIINANQVDNEFLFGFGLDYHGYMRNVPEIRAVDAKHMI